MPGNAMPMVVLLYSVHACACQHRSNGGGACQHGDKHSCTSSIKFKETSEGGYRVMALFKSESWAVQKHDRTKREARLVVSCSWLKLEQNQGPWAVP
jgi:hypothetical protein